MNAEQIMLVQSSWELVEPMAVKLGELFYRRVFELNPSLKELFPDDQRRQGELLMALFGGAVNMLFHIDTLEPSVRDLGRRHRAYGTQPEHYDTFRDALLWTLERVLGEAFTADVRAAWEAVYDYMARTMLEAQLGDTPEHA
jgi:hemoglobin-like flavoprotein